MKILDVEPVDVFMRVGTADIQLDECAYFTVVPTVRHSRAVFQFEAPLSCEIRDSLIARTGHFELHFVENEK